MTPELWQRLKPLFHVALEKDTQDREAFINAACGEDLELKTQLEQLIQADKRGAGSMDALVASVRDVFYAQDTRFQPGELVLERFRIIRLIGKGGMGEVYEAVDLQLGTIAVKTIRHGIASSPGAFERFRREVQLARRVSGPQVCRIHELYLLPASGRYEDTAFLTMEYMDGITLASKIQREAPLPWKEVLNIALEICEGLRLIHEKDIVHRDLKSGNIMLCEQVGDTMRTVLMDFGLAHDYNSDAPGPGDSKPLDQKTSSAMIMGTPEYMAPEQFEAKPVSPATDIYALGIILHELVTGLHPYAADTPVATTIDRAKHPLPPTSFHPTVPRQCHGVIERCLEYDPQNRFQSAKEVAKALQAGLADLDNPRKYQPWMIWLASVLALTLIVWSIFFLRHS